MFKVFLIFSRFLIRDYIKSCRKHSKMSDLIDAVASGRFVMLCVAPGARDRG